MVRSPLTKTISLYDLTQEFKLRSILQPLTIDRLPALTEPEAKALERLRSNYLNLTQRRPLSEEFIRLDRTGTPQYSLSEAFVYFESRNRFTGCSANPKVHWRADCSIQH